MVLTLTFLNNKFNPNLLDKTMVFIFKITYLAVDKIVCFKLTLKNSMEKIKNLITKFTFDVPKVTMLSHCCYFLMKIFVKRNTRL